MTSPTAREVVEGELVGRATGEWVAAHPDQAIPKRVKLRIWARCRGRCAITGRKLNVGDAYDFDHIVPLALGGRHAESNLQLVSKEAHRAKTKADVGAIRKADRQRAYHLGLKPKSSGFRGWRRFDGTIVYRGEK